MSGLTDQEAIRRTLAAYCQTCDDGRFADFADLFAKDAVYHLPGGAVEGREAIRAAIEAAQPPERRGKHLCGEPLIDLGPEHGEAVAATDFVFIGRNGDGGWQVSIPGRYHDRLVREGDVWRFAERRITML
jgi:3-phenylpropionate/cinnamic acid dioxygenase small subunit